MKRWIRIDERMGQRLRWTGLLISLILLSSGITPAHAHANLVRSEPEANAVLDTPPTQIRLWFSETPEPGFSQIQLLDRSGAVIPGVGSLQADPSDSRLLWLRVPILTPGIYTVIWKVLSAADGHVTSGGFAFVVGRDQLPEGGLRPASASASGSGPTLPGVAVRWLSYLAFALLTGGFSFAPVIFQPALNTLARRHKTDKGFRPIRASAAPFSHASGLFAVLVGAWFVLLLVTIAGAFIQAAATDVNWWRLLIGTRYGLLFWGRLLLLILTGALLAFRQSRWWRQERRHRWWQIGTGTSSLLLLTFSLNSHAAAMDQALLPVITDWLHLMAMGLWLGGLVTLLLALRWLSMTEGDNAAPAAGVLMSRFSQVATLCVTIIGVTGIIQAFLQVADVWNLIDTQYGLTLLLKLSLLIPVLGIAAVNLLVIRRRMAAADAHTARPWHRLIRRTVAGEITFLIAILLVTGLLTSTPPAREAFGTGIVMRAQAADLRLIVAANPGIPGLNIFDVYLRDQLDRPIDGVEKVVLIFSMQEHDMGKTEVTAERVEAGHYVAQGGYTSMLGTWNIDTLVRRAGQDDVRATLTMPLVVLSPLSNSPVVASPARVLLGVQIIFAGILLFTGARRLGRIKRWAGWAARLIAGGLIGFGIAAIASSFVTGVNTVMARQNPFLADPASMARGQVVYQARCAMCHGSTGLGDGPAGAALNPKPANFQVHMKQGHTDGELFDWITNGFPGSAMPAFGTQLGEPDRWHVINYIRRFGDAGLAQTPLPTLSAK